MQSKEATHSHVKKEASLKSEVLCIRKNHVLLARSLNYVNPTSDEQQHMTRYTVSSFIEAVCEKLSLGLKEGALLYLFCRDHVTLRRNSPKTSAVKSGFVVEEKIKDKSNYKKMCKCKTTTRRHKCTTVIRKESNQRHERLTNRCRMSTNISLALMGPFTYLRLEAHWLIIRL